MKKSDVKSWFEAKVSRKKLKDLIESVRSRHFTLLGNWKRWERQENVEFSYFFVIMNFKTMVEIEQASPNLKNLLFFQIRAHNGSILRSWKW